MKKIHRKTRCRQAVKIGENLRKMYDPYFEHDVSCLIEMICVDYNIEVVFEDFPNKVQKFNQGWKISFWNNMSYGRFNYAFFHTFGGILFRHDIDDNNVLINPPNESIQGIQRAHFAGNFLAPEKIFRKKYYEFGGDEKKLAKFFEVIQTFCLVRAVVLGLSK